MTRIQNEGNSDMLPAVSVPVFENTAVEGRKLCALKGGWSTKSPTSSALPCDSRRALVSARRHEPHDRAPPFQPGLPGRRPWHPLPARHEGDTRGDAAGGRNRRSRPRATPYGWTRCATRRGWRASTTSARAVEDIAAEDGIAARRVLPGRLLDQARDADGSRGSIRSSPRRTAKGWSPTWRRAHSTAWPRPSGSASSPS